MPEVRAELIISARDQATQVMQQVAQSTKDVTAAVQASSNPLTELRSGVLLAEQAWRALKGAYDSVVNPAAEQQRMLFQTTAVLKSTGDASGYTATQIFNMTDKMATLNGVNRMSLESGANILLTFRQIGHDAFPQALQAAQDLSLAMGQDLRTSIIQVGKALDDPARGLTALRRIGVTFTADQANVIKAMVATGDVAGAQAAILKELNTEFGGSGAANAKTYSGTLEILNNSFEKLKISVGTGLLPPMQTLFTQETSNIDAFRLMNEALSKGIITQGQFSDYQSRAAFGFGNTTQIVNELTAKFKTADDAQQQWNISADEGVRVQGRNAAVLTVSSAATVQDIVYINARTAGVKVMTDAQRDQYLSDMQLQDATAKVDDALDKLNKGAELGKPKVDALKTAYVNAQVALDKLQESIWKTDDLLSKSDAYFHSNAQASSDMTDKVNALAAAEQAKDDQATLSAGIAGKLQAASDAYAATLETNTPKIAKINAELAKLEASQGAVVTATQKGKISTEDYQTLVDRTALALSKYNEALAGTIDKHGHLHTKTANTIEGLRIAYQNYVNMLDDANGKLQTSSTITVDNSTKIAALKAQLDPLVDAENKAAEAIKKVTAQMIEQQVADSLSVEGKKLLMVQLGLWSQSDYDLVTAAQATDNQRKLGLITEDQEIVKLKQLFDQTTWNAGAQVPLAKNIDTTNQSLSNQKENIGAVANTADAKAKAMNDFRERISSVGGEAHHAADDIWSIKSAEDALYSKTITITTVRRDILEQIKDQGQTNAPAPPIPQAAGGDYFVTSPTRFIAGEAGPERATFTPIGKGGAGGATDMAILAALTNLPQMMARAMRDAVQLS